MGIFKPFEYFTIYTQSRSTTVFLTIHRASSGAVSDSHVFSPVQLSHRFFSLPSRYRSPKHFAAARVRHSPPLAALSLPVHSHRKLLNTLRNECRLVFSELDPDKQSASALVQS